jgi:hypothetical protein
MDSAERIALVPGGWFMSASGLSVRFEGASHDHYDDGKTALLLSLSLWDARESSSWLPNALATPESQRILGRCVTVIEGSEHAVVLLIAPAQKGSGRGPVPIVACGVEAVSAPELRDYALVKDGATYHAVVERDPSHGSWRPVATPRMPLHHASRLVWLNLVDHPGLTAKAGSRLRFTFSIDRHEIEAAAGRERQWLASYFATVTAVCEP